MKHIVSPRYRIGPPCVRVQIGRHDFDRSRVRRNLANGRAHFLGPPKVPYGRANAPAIAKKLRDAVPGNVTGPTRDSDDSARGRRSDCGRCHVHSPEFARPNARAAGFKTLQMMRPLTRPQARLQRRRIQGGDRRVRILRKFVNER